MSDDLFVFEEHDPGGKVKHPLPEGIRSSAHFSKCKQYRYILHRWWCTKEEDINSVMFLMMNPSTATEMVDDPTVKKCRMFAELWGFNHLMVTNIMAYRATNPKQLLTVDDAVGPDNLWFVRHHLLRQPPMNKMADLLAPAPFLVCAWGRIPKKLQYAEDQVMEIVREFNPHVLRLNKSGRPWHPLYLPNNSVPVPWNIV